jgi:hypothetical protein
MRETVFPSCNVKVKIIYVCRHILNRVVLLVDNRYSVYLQIIL